jgi:hypothetical protein
MVLVLLTVCDALSIAFPCIHTLHLASHLGTLDAPHEGHDVQANPKMVLVDPSRRWKYLGVHAWNGGVTKTVQANWTYLCQILGKLRSIISLLIFEIHLSIYVICIDALSYRCWMKTLAALIIHPCPKTIPWILYSSGLDRCLALL